MRWILILLVIFFGFFIIRSQIFAIRLVDEDLEKADCVDKNQIRVVSNLLGQNFFLINSAKIENDLKRKFLCIKSVTIERSFPNKARLSVFGRVPAAILVVLKYEEATISSELENFSKTQATQSAQASSSASFIFSIAGPTENFVVDNEGVIYSTSFEQVNAPKVYIGQKVDEDLILNTLKILEKIKVFGVNVKDAKIYSKNILLTDAVPKIIFKLDDKVENQIASLQLILNQAKIDEKELEFIDLRFDKPVVRLAPKKK